MNQNSFVGFDLSPKALRLTGFPTTSRSFEIQDGNLRISQPDDQVKRRVILGVPKTERFVQLRTRPLDRLGRGAVG
jgi:hypothetical protein